MSIGKLETEFEKSNGLIMINENENEICYIVLPFTVLLLYYYYCLFICFCSCASFTYQDSLSQTFILINKFFSETNSKYMGRI
jgi:hypothetical protein